MVRSVFERKVTDALEVRISNNEVSLVDHGNNIVTNAASIQAIYDAYGNADGVAQLDSNGKIPTSQLPAIAVTDVYVKDTIADRDALTVEAGDIVKVVDADGEGNPATFIYDGTDYVDFQESANVISVNDQVGSVYLDHSHIPTQGFSSTNWTAPEANVRGQFRGIDEFLTTTSSGFGNRLDDLEEATHSAVTAADGTISVGDNQEISVALSQDSKGFFPDNLIKTGSDGGLYVSPEILSISKRVIDENARFVVDSIKTNKLSFPGAILALEDAELPDNFTEITFNASAILFENPSLSSATNTQEAIDLIALRGATERRSIPASMDGSVLQLENNSPAIQVLLADQDYPNVPSVELPAVPVKDKHFALINPQSSSFTYFTCNGVEIQPGDRYEVIYDGVEWIEL